MRYSELRRRVDFVNSNKDLVAKEICHFLAYKDYKLNLSDDEKRSFDNRFISQWQFKNDNDINTKTSLELIVIIKKRVIPQLHHHDLKHSWLEQCILFELKNNDFDNYQLIRGDLEKRRKNELTYKVANELFSKTKDSAGTEKFNNTEFLVQTCIDLSKYNEAVQYAKWGYEQFTGNEKLHIQCFLAIALLKRKGNFNAEITDAQYALNLALDLAKYQDYKEYSQNLQKDAIEIILSSDVKKTRGEETHILGDMGRGITRLSKGLGKLFGGRESALPQSKAIMNSAPKLLDNKLIEKELAENKSVQKELNKLISDKHSNKVTGVMAGTVGASMLWTYSQIDSSVMDAISFSSAGNPESFSQIQEIAESTLLNDGALTRLSGYVAEQKVAMDLASSGQTVEFPDSATEAGYDLLVNGEMFQVKCSLDADYVMSHFDKYPDIPILVNSELAEELGGHPNIIPVDSLSYYDVQEITSESVANIADFNESLDLLPIPVIALGFAAYRNFGMYSSGAIDSTQYAQNVGTEFATRAGGALLGGKIGGAIGTVLGPAGTIIGAGLGSYIGGVAGGTGADTLNREQLCDQRDIVVEELTRFARWFNDNLIVKRVEHAKTKYTELKAAVPNFGLESSVSSQFLAYQSELYQRAHDIHIWFNKHLSSDNKEMNANAGWVALDLSRHFVSAELHTKVARVNNALEKYKGIANPEPSQSKKVVNTYS